MKLTILGTGHALVTKCYNTCFALEDEGKVFLVDGGGGNGILVQLEKAKIDKYAIRDIFVTHRHTDHILGALWMIRVLCDGIYEGRISGEARLYAYEDVIGILKNMAYDLLRKEESDLIGKQFFMIPIDEGESREIIGKKVTFFDTGSKKIKQYGFSMELSPAEDESDTDKNPHRDILVCCGDEPLHENVYPYADRAKWLMHEAFCLYSEVDIYKPYGMHHTTVKDAALTAEKLNIENLILYHTEDDNLENRKELYYNEGSEYFHGNLLIPDDLDIINIP